MKILQNGKWFYKVFYSKIKILTVVKENKVIELLILQKNKNKFKYLIIVSYYSYNIYLKWFFIYNLIIYGIKIF